MPKIITYTVNRNGAVLFSGTAKECAKATGLSARTIQTYAENGNPGRQSGITVFRNGESGDESASPDSDGRLLKAMKRRRDDLFGLNANSEWEL